MRSRSLLLALALLGPVIAVDALAAPPADDAAAVTALAPHAADTVLIGFHPSANGLDRAAARRSVNAVAAEQLSPLATDAEKWTLPPGLSVEKAIEVLSRAKGVRYVEPDYIVTTQATSNDPYFTNTSLWGMYGDASQPANQFGSQAAEAWSAGYTGSRSVVIGVIDEGMEVTHPDLAANIWVNPGETAENGVDDDGNGYIDDINGWDFYDNDASVYDGGSTGSSDNHGTHVAGTIGGIGGNGAGVAGVNWNVTMISTKFLGPDGGYLSDAVAALDYLTKLKTDKGINIVATNNSWGGGGYSGALLDAINRGGDAGILFVAAAGNSTANNDRTASFPSNYVCTTQTRTWDCVVAVASITSTGSLSSFSSYGAASVDLGAPGSGIWSTVPSNGYASYSGTSMATPHVTGAIALCASIDSTLNGGALRSILLGSTQPTSSLSGRVVTSGRLDAGLVASRCVPSNPTVSTTALPGATVRTAYSQTLVATGGAGGYRWTSTGTLPAGLSLSSTGVLSGTPTTAGSTTFSVTATDLVGRTASQTLSLSVASPPPVPAAFNKLSPSNLAAIAGTSTALTWGSSTGATTYETCVTRRQPTTNQSACDTGWTNRGASLSASVSGLNRKTTYYWQVRAVNAGGSTQANSGSWWRFTTG